MKISRLRFALCSLAGIASGLAILEARMLVAGYYGFRWRDWLGRDAEGPMLIAELLLVLWISCKIGYRMAYGRRVRMDDSWS